MQKKKTHIKFVKWVDSKSVILATLLVGILLLIAGMFLPVPNIAWLEKLNDLGSENGLTLYLSQLSFTFITISVMSVLSDSSNIIYWENIVERKLIQPKWSCFYAYTTYSFATVLFGGIAGIMGLSLLFMMLFILDILTLMALTFSMIDVYFRHGEKAEMLEREFISFVTDPDEDFKRADKDRAEYRRISNGLKTNTVLAFRNYDVATIYENLGFYARNAQYIPESDFYVLFKCVDEININDFLSFVEEYSFYGINDRTYSDEKFNSLTSLMTRGTSLFSVIFDEKVFPKFAVSMDSNAAERLFLAYRGYLIRTRDAMKATNPEYDRKENGPATFHCRFTLLRTLMNEAMAHRKYILDAFVYAFGDTNVITNYGDNNGDNSLWKCYIHDLPEDPDEAEDIFDSLSDVNRIMYGYSYPDYLDKVSEHNLIRIERTGDSGEGVNGPDWDTPSHDAPYVVMEDYEGDGQLELVDDDSDEEDDDESDGESDIRFDDEDFPPEVEPGEWPPESDSSGLYTLEGSENYARSSDWGKRNDGDIEHKDW